MRGPQLPPTFLPRRYQVTRPTSRLRVRLPPSQYSVTSMVRSACRLAPCREWREGEGMGCRREQGKGVAGCFRETGGLPVQGQRQWLKPRVCLRRALPAALPAPGGSAASTNRCPDSRPAHKEGDDVWVAAGSQDGNLALEVFLALVARRFADGLLGVDGAGGRSVWSARRDGRWAVPHHRRKTAMHLCGSMRKKPVQQRMRAAAGTDGLLATNRDPPLAL